MARNTQKCEIRYSQPLQRCQKYTTQPLIQDKFSAFLTSVKWLCWTIAQLLGCRFYQDRLLPAEPYNLSKP